MTDYIIHKPSKSILLPLSRQELVLAIPKSRLVEFSGKTVIQIKHDEENTLALNRAGFSVPAPLEIYYSFKKVKGRFPAFQHQRDAAAFASLHKRCHLLLPLGTGKSFTSISAADAMIEMGVIKKVLILCPLSCMRPVWDDEIFTGFPDRSSTIVYGTAKQRVERLEEPVDFFISNHALLQVAVEAKSIKDRTVYQLRPEFEKLKEIDLIIFDESSMLRNAQTHMWHAMKVLLQEHTRLLMLSGYPCPSSPENAWSQSMLVNPSKTPKYFGEWRRQVCYEEKRGQFSKWIPRKGSEELVFKLLQPAYHVDKSKVLDLPEMTIERREVELSKEQQAQYRKMHNQLVMEFRESGEKLTAVSAADKMLKLRQILIGSVKTGDGEYSDFEDIPRIKTILEIIEQSENKVVVVSPFTGALHNVADAIRKKKYSVDIIEGSVDVKDRDRIIRSFQEDKDPHVLVVQGQAVSHGVTLTAASVMIFLGPVTGNDQYQQLLGRLNRTGQKNRMVVFQLYANSMETRLYDALENAQNYQEAVMDLFKQEMLSK